MVTTPRLRPEASLLVWAASRLAGAPRPDLCATPAGEIGSWKLALWGAAWQKLLPVLHYLHDEDPSFPPIPQWALRHLELAHKSSVAQWLGHMAHLQQMLSALRDDDIPVVVLKGLGLAESLYPRPAMRLAGDIDLLVPRPALDRAERVLETLGFHGPESVSLREAYRDHHHHLAPMTHENTGALVEIHWAIAPTSRPQQLDVQGLWERARHTEIAGLPCMTLPLEDQLLHLCLHFVTDRQSPQPGSILQLCDIALFQQRYGDTIRWDVLAERGMQSSLQFPVYVALYAARLVVGVAGPEEPLRALRPAEFDDSRAMLFVLHRVISPGKQAPDSVVRSLAPRGLRDKVREMRQAMRPPRVWSPPGAESGPMARPRWSWFRSAASLLRRIVDLPKGAFRLSGVRRQVMIDRWLSRELGAPVREASTAATAPAQGRWSATALSGRGAEVSVHSADAARTGSQ